MDSRSLQSCRGASLVEVIVVMLVSAILIAIAAPRVSSTTEIAQRNQLVRQFEFDVARLRAEALSAGVRALLQTASSGSIYRGGLDVLPYGATPQLDQEVFSALLPYGMTMAFNNTIIMDSRGFPVDAFGQSTTYTATMYSHGQSFCVATIAVSGSMTFSCRPGGL